MSLNKHNQLLPFGAALVRFDSLSDHQRRQEYLRCTDKFHGRKRKDTCLVSQPDGTMAFARLQLVFTCKAGDRTWQCARVTLFRTVTSPETSNTGMRRVREDTHGAFIELSWIVRGVFLSPAFEEADYPRDFFVNDLLDKDCGPDLYLRLRALQNCV